MSRIHTVHIISKDKTPAGGNVPDKQIAASVDVLNADYAQSGVSFSLVNTTRTVNSTWFDELGPAKSAAAIPFLVTLAQLSIV